MILPIPVIIEDYQILHNPNNKYTDAVISFMHTSLVLFIKDICAYLMDSYAL